MNNTNNIFASLPKDILNITNSYLDELIFFEKLKPCLSLISHSRICKICKKKNATWKDYFSPYWYCNKCTDKRYFDPIIYPTINNCRTLGVYLHIKDIKKKRF